MSCNECLKNVRECLRPYTLGWFISRFKEFTPPQEAAIPKIKCGENVLISSPTGTGKTLAAFLAIIDELYKLSESKALEDRVYAIYVSPLRALNNDMVKNLMIPLKEIKEYAKSLGIELPEVRVAVRTSDTSPYEKSKMVKKPPHILITTPESLTISITAPKFREKLRSVRWVVVDEIHEIASSKRGALLSLTLERLEELSEGRIQRIGLSATISPLEDIAQFLVGFDEDGRPRECSIVDARFVKPMELTIIAPHTDMVKASAEELNTAIYETLKEVIEKHRTTLIFTNTRSSTEKVVFKLKKMFKENGVESLDSIEAHHSSLSRDVRLEVENKLKEGKLKAVVSSTSLELGIDVGYIDAVVLLSSPKSVTRLIQRVGRSGHNVRDVSKGYLIAVDRDDLIEVTVLTNLAKARKLDKTSIPEKPLDILAQHLVGMSLERKWSVEEAYKVVKRAYNYRNLSFEEFLNVLKYLAGRFEDGLVGLPVYSKIWFDEVEGVFGRKKSVRMIYYLNSGAIPDEAKVRVFLDGRRYIGDLEEEFVEYLDPGDIFVLGGKTYQFLRSEGMKVIVRNAEGQRPTVPAWFSEMLPLTYESALEVGRFREYVAELIKNEGFDKAVEKLINAYGLGLNEAKHIVQYISDQLTYGGFIPSDKRVVIEVWEDFSEGVTNVIFHYLFGRRVNQALSRAYALALSESLGVAVRVTVSDNGFMLTIPNYVVLDINTLKKVVKEVSHENLRSLLRKSLRRSELMKRKFRHVAERALALLKNYRGVETSVYRRQVNSEALLKAAEKIPGFPLIEETYREIMEDVMDVKNAEEVLKKIREGEVEVIIVKSEAPSPFSHNIIAQGYSDVVLMEDRRKLIQKLYEKLLKVRNSSKTDFNLHSL